MYFLDIMLYVGTQIIKKKKIINTKTSNFILVCKHDNINLNQNMVILKCFPEYRSKRIINFI